MKDGSSGEYVMREINNIIAANINDKPNNHSVYYFAGVDNARFKKPVIPGDQLHLNVSIERRIKGFWKYKGSALVENEIVAEAEITCILKEI